MSCTDLDTPETAEFNATSSGTYSTQKIESSDASQTSFSILGLESTSENYVFNGNFKRDGNQQITINQNTRSLNSAVYLEIVNLNVDKVNYEIISGSGTLTLTGKANQGNSFSFEGTLIFNGNETATLTLNGTSYEINLN
jgi:hypothetical protein